MGIKESPVKQEQMAEPLTSIQPGQIVRMDVLDLQWMTVLIKPILVRIRIIPNKIHVIQLIITGCVLGEEMVEPPIHGLDMLTMPMVEELVMILEARPTSG